MRFKNRHPLPMSSQTPYMSGCQGAASDEAPTDSFSAGPEKRARPRKSYAFSRQKAKQNKVKQNKILQKKGESLKPATTRGNLRELFLNIPRRKLTYSVFCSWMIIAYKG